MTRSRFDTAFVLAATVLCGACGSPDAGASPATETESAAASAPAPTDPCALIPIAEWEAATGYTDIRSDRSASDTCDFLSDDLWGVVGSVVLPARAMLEHPPRMAGETPTIAGLGDEALWLGTGPIVRVGETVVWITVHPNVRNQRDVGIALARIAIGRL